MKPLNIGNLKVSIPIVQGGMGVGISMSNLSSAVAQQGGVGVISAAGLGMFENNRTRDYLEASLNRLTTEIRKAKKKTEGALGVNIMVAMNGFGDHVKTAIREKIDIIFAGAGLPLDLPRYLKKGVNTKLVPIISSARAAKIITEKWLRNFDYLPDAFVIEGPKAGGHLGFKKKELEDPDYQLETLLSKTRTALEPYEDRHHASIPLIVAGGVFDGADMHRFLRAGAQGVQLGTRFVATEECDASSVFKDMYVQAESSDVRLVDSPVGLPGRAIRNAFLKAVDAGETHPFSCPFECISTCKKEDAPYCISLALYNAQRGHMKRGFAFAGANVGRVKRIVSVAELFKELKEGYAKTEELSRGNLTLSKNG